MKYPFLIVSTFCLLVLCACNRRVISDKLHFCESVCAYDNGLLIANFGGNKLNPLNTEGKGYITFYKDHKMAVLLPADGYMSAPKGLAVRGNYLFVADVNKILLYDLVNKNDPPQVIPFPEADVFVNDLEIIGEVLLASVTNTGNIYALDISNPASVDPNSLAIYAMVPGANGLLSAYGKLFIASYAPDGVSKEENVIYLIDDLTRPVVQSLTHRAGQYDGLALSSNGEYLFFTDWNQGVLGKLCLATGAIETIATPIKIDGPADMDWYGDQLAIPDLVNSRVILVNNVLSDK